MAGIQRYQHTLKLVFTCLCLLFSSAAQAGEIIHTKVEHEDKRYFVEIEILLNADDKRVLELLTDYDHLTRLNNSIKESYTLYSLDDSTHRVLVVTEACILFFCKRITQVQDVEELPGGIIITTVVPEKSDFDYAHTRWKISPEGGRTHVSFSTDLKPSFWIPPLIGPPLIKNKLIDEALATIEGLEKLAQDSP